MNTEVSLREPKQMPRCLPGAKTNGDVTSGGAKKCLSTLQGAKTIAEFSFREPKKSYVSFTGPLPNA